MINPQRNTAYIIMVTLIMVTCAKCGILYIYYSDPLNNKATIAGQLGLVQKEMPKKKKQNT